MMSTSTSMQVKILLDGLGGANPAVNTPRPSRGVCVCVFFPFILDIKFVGRTSRGHTGGRSHRILGVQG